MEHDHREASGNGVELVTLARLGAVATLTMNRHERGNALVAPMKQQLRDCLEQVAADPAVRCVVLTGSGRAFCAGQDLAEHADELRADPASAFRTVTEHYNPIVTALATMQKPVVAAINGTCVGAGLGLALACDLRIVAESVKFATAFTAIGLTCDSGLSATLARAVGQARAAELVITGRAFDAQEALAWGIAGQVIPDSELAEAAAQLAARLAAGPTQAYAEVKRALAGAYEPLETVLRAEAAAQARLGMTADHRGAVEAFWRKEKPTFSGS